MAVKRFWKRLTIILIVALVAIGTGIYVFTLLSSSVTQYSHDYVYELPFPKGSSYKIVQGYGGLFSHQHAAALDFNMPVGTAVHAAREGMIYSYKDESDEGGPFASYKRKANYIMIRHSDGSFGCYWHLRKDGVVIKTGPVKKGELIGYSGATGFTLRPHLHFSVKRILSYDKDSFVKTKFRTNQGIEQLENKELYTRPD
ncbi:MAG: M23 family metallopeptidase [Pedobacter sp.]|nr:MAG: M23 family metallopeptidase [Pedobacter sp.]